MELDLHGRNLFQARQMMDTALCRATAADYRLRVIHGYSGGQAIKRLLADEYARHPRILRIEPNPNPGITVFVLREY